MGTETLRMLAETGEKHFGFAETLRVLAERHFGFAETLRALAETHFEFSNTVPELVPSKHMPDIGVTLLPPVPAPLFPHGKGK